MPSYLACLSACRAVLEPLWPECCLSECRAVLEPLWPECCLSECRAVLEPLWPECCLSEWGLCAYDHTTNDRLFSRLLPGQVRGTAKDKLAMLARLKQRSMDVLKDIPGYTPVQRQGTSERAVDERVRC
eukprot:359188-Chlamydomonas_euryale.AAC.13